MSLKATERDRSDGKFRSLSVTQETFNALEELRREEQRVLGLPELPWNSFLSRMAKKLKSATKK